MCGSSVKTDTGHTLPHKIGPPARFCVGKNREFAHIRPDVHAMELMFICRPAEGARPRVGDLPDTRQVGIEWLEVAKLDSYRLYPLGLRSLIARHEDPTVPVYVGDIY